MVDRKFVGLDRRILRGETGRGDPSGEAGVATLGGSNGVATLERPGVGMRVWARSGGARRRHESRRLRRFAMASSCVMAVGGGASLRASATM